LGDSKLEVKDYGGGQAGVPLAALSRLGGSLLFVWLKANQVK